MQNFKVSDNDLPFIDSEKDVKEYLDPNDNYKLILWDGFTCPPESFIEVPEGADTLAGSKGSSYARYFWNHKNKIIIGTGDSLERYPEWEDSNSITAEQWLLGINDDDFGILWQRNPQEESLNDQIASAEEALNYKIGSANGGGKKQPVKSDGGSSSYYFTKLPQHFIDEIIASGGIEIKDIVRHCFYNDADCKDIIKALKRIQESKRGGGKLGVDVSYDANKILFFANEIKNSIENLNRELKIMQRG